MKDSLVSWADEPVFPLMFTTTVHGRLATEPLSVSQTDLVADEVQVGHGGGLVPRTDVQTRGLGHLAVRPSRLQTATPAQHRDTTEIRIQSV